MCDCKRRRTIWLTIDKTCAFGSQVMISSQGTKSSFHSQCKFETGMVKKEQQHKVWNWVNVPFLTWVFHDLCVWDQVWNVPWEALGSYRCFLFLLRRYPKAFSQIVCLSRKIFNFLFFGFSEVLHFTPLINPSWVGTEKLRNRTGCVCKVQKQQCVMNHGDLHSPPHFVIPFEIFLPTSLCYCRSNSKLLEVYTIVKVYTEEAKKLLSPSTQKLLERGVIIILKSWQTNVHLLRFTFRSFHKISIKIKSILVLTYQ